MDYALEPSNRRRSSLRRAVSVETAVASDYWDGSIPLLATDLSPEGMWLESELPLGVGEEVLVTLRPPRWTEEQPLIAIAEVARVGLFRRERERRTSGMGLRFVELERVHAELLRATLRGLPPPLPKRARATTIEIERPSIEEVFGFPPIVLADGSSFTLRAEGALLTAGRGPLQLDEMASSERTRASADVLRISSPMSAIFEQGTPVLRIAG